MKAEAREPVSLVSLSLPPVSTFEKSCARCHGPQGSFYGAEFAKLANEELVGITREMMEGPAFLKPTDTDVRAMVAYHHALTAAEPFIVVTAHQPATGVSAGWVRGEAAPGAAVFIAGSQSQRVQAGEEGRWEIKDLRDPGPPIVTAEKGDKTTRLDLTQAQWSHAGVREP